MREIDSPIPPLIRAYIGVISALEPKYQMFACVLIEPAIPVMGCNTRFGEAANDQQTPEGPRLA